MSFTFSHKSHLLLTLVTTHVRLHEGAVHLSESRIERAHQAQVAGNNLVRRITAEETEKEEKDRR